MGPESRNKQPSRVSQEIQQTETGGEAMWSRGRSDPVTHQGMPTAAGSWTK